MPDTTRRAGLLPPLARIEQAIAEVDFPLCEPLLTREQRAWIAIHLPTRQRALKPAEELLAEAP